MGLRDTIIIRLFERTNSSRGLESLFKTIRSPKIDQKTIESASSCFQRFKFALTSKYRTISSSRLDGFSSQSRISSRIVSIRSWSSMLLFIFTKMYQKEPRWRKENNRSCQYHTWNPSTPKYIPAHRTHSWLLPQKSRNERHANDCGNNGYLTRYVERQD